MIAPRVVLTAGHCVKGASRWTVTAPFADNQRAVSTTAFTEYTGAGLLNPRAIDIALVVLDSPITLTAYPSTAREPIRPNTLVINVGRVRDGVLSSSALFYGRPVAVERGLPYGYPNSYVSDEVSQSGDSGGPVYVVTPAGRRIVAVSSGAANGAQVLGRVDLAASDIDRILGETAARP